MTEEAGSPRGTLHPWPEGQAGVEVLYEDQELLAVNKPPGWAVHAAPGPGRSLLAELRKRFDGSLLHPVHRLDREVSGVLLLAKSKAAARKVERRWEEVQKCYWVLVQGLPAESPGLIDAPILEHQTSKPERMQRAIRYWTAQHPAQDLPPLPPPKTSAVHPAGRASQTAFRLLGRCHKGTARFALLEVKPRQGRMHQIRVHLRHHGLPLAVDRLYGRPLGLTGRDLGLEGPERERVLLDRVSMHAAGLILPHPFQEEARLALEAPLPEDLRTVCEILGLLPGISGPLGALNS